MFEAIEEGLEIYKMVVKKMLYSAKSEDRDTIHRLEGMETVLGLSKKETKKIHQEIQKHIKREMGVPGNKLSGLSFMPKL